MVTQILTILTTLVASSYPLVDLSHGQLNVYGSVPGLDPSPYYSIQVRAADGRSGWREAFTWLTECTAEKFCNTTGAFNYLANWSNSYINFEMEAGAEVAVKITKLWGDEPITKAVVRPRQAATSCEVTEAGEAVVTINKPGLFTVDINGQMDDQDTGKLPNSRGFYDGPPIHTVTIFANPILEDKPSLEDAGVHQVSPGEQPPTEGDWDTLYFLPGVHDIGHSYPVRGSRRYYIPGDALVYGTINSFASPGDTDNVTIYGHGTLSGDRLPHPHYSDLPEAEHWRYGPVGIQHTPGTRLLGLTVANSAYHSVMLQQGTSDRPILVSWVKMMTWRANGDGFNPQKFAVMEDCFIRTQDDSSYVNGLGIRRVVYWQDSNGATFKLNGLGREDMNSHPLVVEDITVVYARAHWHHWHGGALFNLPAVGHGEGGYTLTFRNIVVEDPRPTLQSFKIMMEGVAPYPEDRKRGAGDIHGIVFQNISIAAHSVLGEPEMLWGMEDGLIYGLVFDNVTIGGDKVEGVEYFYRNEFVFN